MEEDYYSDDDEKVEAKINIYYFNKISNILKSAKITVKDYFESIVYLTQKQLNELYKGEPITLNLKAKINIPKTNIFDFLTKDRSNLPSIIYLSLDQYMIYSRHKLSTKKFKITLSKKQLSATLKEIKKINKQIDSFFIEFKNKNKNYNILVNEEYNRFISNLTKYSSKTPMLESRKQKISKVVKTLLEKTQRLGKYHQVLVNIDLDSIYKFIKKCIKGNTKGSFNLKLYNYYKENKKVSIFPFVLFLTATQKKQLKIWPENERTFKLTLSNNQFHKTCFATILLNRDIYHLTKYNSLPPAPKIKRITPLLAIEMKNLIDFDNPPTTSKPDLIPTSSKPDLIPTSKTKQKPVNKLNEVMEKNLLDFTKEPYKQFTPYQSGKKINTEVRNTLITEIKYPLTKDIIGIKLTKELKEKISKLTNEAAIGLTWIIRALVESSKGKLNVYYANNNYYHLSKKQIKEIVEYYFTSLSLLLNPAQRN